MLRQNIAYTTSNIANNSIPKFGIVEEKKKEGLLDALQAGADNYFKYSDLLSQKSDAEQNRELKQGLLDALDEGDKEAIQTAYAKFDPKGYFDSTNKFEQQKDLLGVKNQYDMILQNLKNQGMSNLSSSAKNFEYLKSKGLDDTQAMAIAFGGNTEAVGGALASGSLGLKGQDKFLQETGKNLAEERGQLIEQQASLPEVKRNVEELRNLSKDATFTLAGQARDLIKKELWGQPTEGAIARTKFQSVIDNQVLPLLKQTFGAAMTVEEGNRLRATMGDVNKTPDEKIAALDAFIAQKEANIRSQQRIVNEYSGKQKSLADYKSKYGLR